MSSNSLTLIFPCYNEEQRLSRLFDELEANHLMLENLGLKEIVFVDDGSSDQTSTLIEGFQNQFKTIKVTLLRQQNNSGKGPAIQRGDAHAQTELRAFLDIDLSTPLSALIAGIQKITSSPLCELLIGSRHCVGAHLAKPQGFARFFLGRIFSFFVSLMHKSAFSDTQCGFKIWTKKFSTTIVQPLKSTRWSFDIQWILQAEQKNFEIEECPVEWKDDDQTKVSALKDGLQMVREVLKYRLRFGSRIQLALFAIMFIVGLNMALRSSNDFLIYYSKAWQPLSLGITNIYEINRTGQGGFYYSPLFALAGIPFTWMDHTTSKFAYYLIYAFMVLVGWVLLKRIFRYSEIKLSTHTSVGILFLFALMNNYFGQALSGNLSAQIMFLILISFYLYIFGHIKSAALFLAVAINFKVYPIFLMIYFLAKKDWRFLIWTFVFCMATIVVPSIFIGWAENLTMHLQQFEMITKYGAQNDLGRLPYQSLSAAFVRLGRFFEWQDSFSMRLGQILGLSILIFFYQKWGFQTSRNKLLQFSLTLFIMGLIAPASWVHHFGFVYAPAILFVLGTVLITKDKLAIFTYSLFFIFYCLTTQGILGKHWNNLLEFWNIPTLGLLFLLYSFCRLGSYQIAPHRT